MLLVCSYTKKEQKEFFVLSVPIILRFLINDIIYQWA